MKKRYKTILFIGIILLFRFLEYVQRRSAYGVNNTRRTYKQSHEHCCKIPENQHKFHRNQHQQKDRSPEKLHAEPE